jgi:RNA polymerase sigma-70 factor (ECF subfamily)
MLSTSIKKSWLECASQQLFKIGYQIHGDLDLSVQDFLEQLADILEKQGNLADSPALILESLDRLYIEDLYLTVACAGSSNRAWSRFETLYQPLIFQTAHRFCGNRTIADDVAETIAAHLYLRDTSGHPRIQSYDGRVALTTWLRSIIANRVLDELALKHCHFARVDLLPDLADQRGLQTVIAGVRANRYGKMITAALETAFASLEEPERLLLELIYVKALRSREVAELFATCKSNITYHLHKVLRKLKQRVIEVLQQRYRLNQDAVCECLEELLDNPGYAVLRLIKTAGPDRYASQ